MSFSQLPAVKKDTENGAPGNFFGPPYFVTALVKGQRKPNSNKNMGQKDTYRIKSTSESLKKPAKMKQYLSTVLPSDRRCL